MNDYVAEAKRLKVKNTLTRHFFNEQQYSLTLHSLIINFKKQGVNKYDFLEFCKGYMQPELIADIAKNTKNQSNDSLWHEMRYGRITASKAYEATKCQTMEGVLVENILGAKIFQTVSMLRGINLENDVLKILQEKTSLKFSKAGLFLSKEFPIAGASPDGINSNSKNIHKLYR